MNQWQRHCQKRERPHGHGSPVWLRSKLEAGRNRDKKRSTQVFRFTFFRAKGSTTSPRSGLYTPITTPDNARNEKWKGTAAIQREPDASRTARAHCPFCSLYMFVMMAFDCESHMHTKCRNRQEDSVTKKAASSPRQNQESIDPVQARISGRRTGWTQQYVMQERRLDRDRMIAITLVL